jgi:MFS family permease
MIIALLLGFCFIVYEYAIRVSDSVLIPTLMHALHIDAFQIGLLSNAYYFPYILMQLPAGLIIDHYGLFRSWIAALLIAAVGCYIFSHSGTFESAVLGRAFMGVGSAFAWVGIIHLIHRYFSPKKQGTLIGISMTLCMVGALVGQAPWLWITQKLASWQQPFLLASLVGILLSLAFIYFMKQERKKKVLSLGAEIIQFMQKIALLKTYLRQKYFWYLALYITAISLPQNAFSTLWAIEFFRDSLHFSAQKSSLIVSAIWFGGIVGAPIMGMISDSLASQKNLLLACNFLVLCLVMILMWVPVHSMMAAIVLLFWIGFLSNISVVIYAKASQMSSHISSTLVSSINMINMLGASLVQLLMSYVLSLTNEGSQLLHFSEALLIMPILLLLSLLWSFRT